MVSIVGIVLGLVVLCVACLFLGLPGIFLGLRAVRKNPEKATRSALLWSAFSGLFAGAVLGGTGLVWGAGIGDESAGAIATVLLTGGCVSGVLGGALMTFGVISVVSKKGPRD
jgi:hypothetical protein